MEILAETYCRGHLVGIFGNSDNNVYVGFQCHCFLKLFWPMKFVKMGAKRQYQADVI